MVPLLLASIPGVSDHFSLTWLLTYCGYRFHGCDVGINLKMQYRKPTFFVPYNLYDVKVSFEEHRVLTWKKWRAVPTFPRCIRIYFFFLSLYSMINMLANFSAIPTYAVLGRTWTDTDGLINARLDDPRGDMPSTSEFPKSNDATISSCFWLWWVSKVF